MKKKQSKVYLFPAAMLGITATAGMIANIPGANADDNPAIDDTINITVDSSCTMGQTVTSSHATELNPGETNANIGESRIAAYCNDNEGYAIYAIGYTNGEYGNTNLVSTDGNHTIPTGTSGSNSYWNMKLTQGTATGTTSYLPTMVNEFTTNTTIPNDYTKVAYRDSSTISQNQDPTETGSYFTTTYSAYIDTTQPAGIYNGQVQYVMVHPSSAPAPEAPLTMQNTSAIKRKLVNIGDTTQATDSRDGKKYWVTKLADGNIWMTQNLDFDIDSTKTYTSADTDIPTDWTPTRSTTTGTTWDSSIKGRTTPHSHDPGNRYWDGGIKSSYYSSSSQALDSGGEHYKYGNYYNWTAAVAMNNSSSYTSRIDANQSICPAGWRLPTYRGNKSFQNLVNAYNLTAGVRGNVHLEPSYFVYGGYWQEEINYAKLDGHYWTGTSGSSSVSFSMNFSSEDGGSLAPTDTSMRSLGFFVRCVMR